MKSASSNFMIILSVASLAITLSLTQERHPIFTVGLHNVEKVKAILEADPKAVYARDENGSTPLHYLARLRSYNVTFSSDLRGTAKEIQETEPSPVAVFLISKKANVNAKDNKGVTPLHLAIANGNFALSKLLVENEADVNATVEKELGLEGTTPLIFAVANGDTKTMTLLITKGANVNQADKKKQTPLHIAVLYNQISAADLLLRKGAKVKSEDVEGMTPFGIALEKHNAKMIELLQRHTDKEETIETYTKEEMQINPNVSVHIFGVRSWSPPEQQYTLLESITNKSFNYWSLDNLHLADHTGMIMTKGRTGMKISTIKTGSEFARKVVKTFQPKGKFVEVLLIFTNIGIDSIKEGLLQSDRSELDIRLLLQKGKDVFPTDFLCPGVSGCSLAEYKNLHKKGLTVVSELNIKPGGWLGFNLEPGEETYALLLFDVPKEAESVLLRFKEAVTMQLQLKQDDAAWKKIAVLCGIVAFAFILFFIIYRILRSPFYIIKVR